MLNTIQWTSIQTITHGNPSPSLNTEFNTEWNKASSKLNESWFKNINSFLNNNSSENTIQSLFVKFESIQSKGNQFLSNEVLNQIHNAGISNQSLAHPIINSPLYDVKPETKSAIVPEEWSADSVSTRIVQFTIMRFHTISEPNFESIEKISEALKDGFKKANEIIGPVPEDIAQLFNKTFEETIAKWEAATEKLTKLFT
jgi:hypothetical protein